MYFYFYDKFVQEQKYESVLTKIETKLIDLRINGRIEKLSIFKNARELIEDGIKKGAHTVIAVGDDKTFISVVNIVAPYEGITLGFIPVVEDSKYAKVLGMPAGEEACQVISRRLYETVDLGMVNDQYFLGSVYLPSHHALQMNCDDQYTVATTTKTNEVRILNLGDVLGKAEPRIASPGDGKIELVVSPTAKTGLFKKKQGTDGAKESVFPVEKLTVTSKGETLALDIDKTFTVNTPCEVTVLPGALKLIVGKDRLLSRK